MPAGMSILKGEVAKYRLVERIGSGGMAEVWLAEVQEASSSIPARVAVKVAKPEPPAVEKLLFEQRVLSDLRHENIPSLFDKGSYNGRPFIAVEYVEGANLESIVQSSPLEENVARKLIAQLLIALDYIHSLNIVHRDVKPKNIIVHPERLFPLKLIDFGTATYYNKAGIRDAVISPGGYTAPEQFRFMSSPQSDIWGAGAVLFYMLTGRHPAEVLEGYPSKPPLKPIDPRMYNKDVSDELARIVLKAMEWDPLFRYLSAREMLMDIEGIREEYPDVPVLEVMGYRVKLDEPVVRFGRMEWREPTPPKERVRVTREGGVIYIEVYDPFNWISRQHFEITYRGGAWFIRDLGSLNRTAVLTRGRLIELSIAPRVEGPLVELGDRAIIYVAYGPSLNNPPYMIVTFRRGHPE